MCSGGGGGGTQEQLNQYTTSGNWNMDKCVGRRTNTGWILNAAAGRVHGGEGQMEGRGGTGMGRQRRDGGEGVRWRNEIKLMKGI